MYAEFNVKLFFYLLFKEGTIFNANDLDTLPANYLVTLLKNKKLVYDSHEYFTEVPEVQHRPVVKKVWEAIEKIMLPRANEVYTVNDSLARIFSEKYNRYIGVIRNLPLTQNSLSFRHSKKELGLPDDKNIIILQGAGINVDRGAEELVSSMKHLDNFYLVIVGSGDVFPKLETLIKKNELSEKIKITGRLPYEQMMEYTAIADLGLSLDKDTNPNYRFSLPNKFFDYLRAETPVLTSDLPELKSLIEKYEIGDTIDSHDPKDIAKKIESIFRNRQALNIWQENTKMAIQELSWENEEQKLLRIYNETLQINGQ